jgi:hypothetical protein
LVRDRVWRSFDISFFVSSNKSVLIIKPNVRSLLAAFLLRLVALTAFPTCVCVCVCVCRGRGAVDKRAVMGVRVSVKQEVEEDEGAPVTYDDACKPRGITHGVCNLGGAYPGTHTSILEEVIWDQRSPVT